MPSHARYRHDDGEGSSSEEESEYASGSEEEESGSYEEEEEGSSSGSYVDEDKENSSQTSDYSKDEESAHSLEEDEGSYSSSYDDDGSLQSGREEGDGEDDNENGSYSSSYEEENEKGDGSYSGSDEEEDDEGSHSEEPENREDGSYSGSCDEEEDDNGSHSEEPDNREDGSYSGSCDEEEDDDGSHSEEPENREDGSFTGSNEDEDGRSANSQEEEEGSSSGSYDEDISQSQEAESEQGSQSGSSVEEGSQAPETEAEEGSSSGSYEDEVSEAGSNPQNLDDEEGSCTGSYEEEGEESSQSLEQGEGASSSEIMAQDEHEGGSEGSVSGNAEGSFSGSRGNESDEERSQSLSQESESREDGSDTGSYDSEDAEENPQPQHGEDDEETNCSYEEGSASRDSEGPYSEEGSIQSGDESEYFSQDGSEEASRSQEGTDLSATDEESRAEVSHSEESEGKEGSEFQDVEQADSVEEKSCSEQDGSGTVLSESDKSPQGDASRHGTDDDVNPEERELKQEKYSNEHAFADEQSSEKTETVFPTQAEGALTASSEDPFSFATMESDGFIASAENAFADLAEDSFQHSRTSKFSASGMDSRVDGPQADSFVAKTAADIGIEQSVSSAFSPNSAYSGGEGKANPDSLESDPFGQPVPFKSDFGAFEDGFQGENFDNTQPTGVFFGSTAKATEGENLEEASMGPGNSLLDTNSQSLDSYDARIETFGRKAIPDNPSSSLTLGATLSQDKIEVLDGDQKSVGSQRSGSSRLSISNRRSGAKRNDKKGMNQTRTITAYTREQMTKLAQVPREKMVSNDDDEDISVPSRDAAGNKKRNKRKNKRPVRVKSEALLELANSINSAMIELENLEKEQPDKIHGGKGEEKEDDNKDTGREGNDINQDTQQPANQVMHSFETLVGIFLRLSDELELLSTFAKKSDSVAIEALKTLLSYTDIVEDIFSQIKPILQEYLFKSVDDEMEDFLYGMNLIVEQLCEICYHVGEKHQWNARANTSYLTLLELLARDSLEVTCIYDDVDTPDYPVTEEIQQAWEATGHDEEIKTLLVSSSDLSMFRQICYEVMLSCDQWCPDTDALMDICAIEESMVEQNKQDHPDDMVPPPEGALQVLEKINGEYLLRIPTMASILRRILPAEAVTDPRMKDSFARIRSTIRNPLGLSPSTLVSISSIPEDPDDEEALGVAGVGKTTIAAMVANHQDVRRFFCDGIAWIYVGPTELNYTRYVQCLQDLIGQLELEEEDEPAFPELLHVPGESKTKRRRREEGFMIFVRQIMIDFFEGLNVLIILDDVCFDPDLDWFDFTPPPTVDPEDEEGSCVVLVTSRRRNLLPDADTVEVDMLEEKEAVKLLVKESQALSSILVPDSQEIKKVVTECANHALAVKSVGRWLNLKHASNGVATSTAEEIQLDVVRSIDRILKTSSHGEADMMYELLNMSMSPAINSEPTSIIKFCFAAFVQVFCERRHISDFALADSTPIVPLAIAEKLFEALLNLEEGNLKKEISLFHSENGEAASLIPQALAALGLFKVIVTFVDEDSQDEKADEEEKFVQIMHKIQQEYGEYLCEEDPALGDLAKDGERRWNKAFAQAFLTQACDWGTENPDAGMDYALEMMPCHMYRGGMFKEAGNLLCNTSFVKGRLFALGRENGTRRHIKDIEALFELMKEQRAAGNKKMDPKRMMKGAYDTLSGLLFMDEDDLIAEEGSPEAVEVGRSHFDIGLSLSERRCWEAALYHWEKSQELFVSSLGLVELVAGVLNNVGIVYAEMNDYEKSLSSLKQCLRIRGAIHGEEHILYAQTIQRIGDVLLKMSDYQEAMESYNWTLDVMHIEPNHHRIDIGDVLENMGSIHYSKGEVDEALRCFQDALRSKQVDLGEDHPELASTFHRIGDCLSDQGKTDEAIAHYEEAIRLKNLDPDGGFERDADVLTIEGILHNLQGRQREGVDSYEKALQVLVTKVPHRKEKVAGLLHMIGCVYLMSGEHKRAMKLFEESLQARRKVLGFVHLDVASTLFNMAFLHQSRNRLDKALKCLEEALKIRQLRLPDTEKVAVTHEKIGNLSRALGKTKKAEIAFNEALRIRKIVHGDNHEAVATVLQELGDLMDDLGESDTAMKHYVLALEIRESRLGPDDLAVAETYYSMGFTLQNNDAVDRALQCFEESLSIRKFQLGDDAKEVGDTLNMMGFIQAQRGELEDAISLLWEALRIRKLHDDRVKVSETLKNIGNVHREKHEYELAIECYEECLRIRRRELGDVHEKLADALLAMGHAQSDMNLTDEAMESYREALTIRIRLFGEQDESVAVVLQYMGTLEFRAIRLDRAFQLLDEFIRIRQDNGTDPDGDYVNVLFMIGNIHKMQGRESEAQKCWTEAYDVFQELGMADGNPHIAEVMSTLVRDDDKKRRNRFKRKQSKSKDSGTVNGNKGKESKDDIGPSPVKNVFGKLAGKMKGGRGKKSRGHQL